MMQDDGRGGITPYERGLVNRGVTPEQQEIKMGNLIKLAKEGFRVIKAIEHDCYEVEGKAGLYNPYTNEWSII